MLLRDLSLRQAATESQLWLSHDEMGGVAGRMVIEGDFWQGFAGRSDGGYTLGISVAIRFVVSYTASYFRIRRELLPYCMECLAGFRCSTG